MLLQSFFAGVVGASSPPPLPFEASALCVSGQLEGLSGSNPETPIHSNSHSCVCAAMCHGGALAGGPGGFAFAFDVLGTQGADAPLADLSPAPQLRLPPARAPPHDGHASFA
jgi:hypothetical protein